MKLMTPLAAMVLLALGASNVVAQPQELRPNLQAFPAQDIQLEVDPVGRTMLRFTTLTWNNGDGPLEIEAGETGQDRKGNNRQNVYQNVYLDDGTSYQRLAGAFVWHPGHNHFHMDNYADYTLQPKGAKGKAKLTGSKTSFCLMDSNRIDTTLPNAPSSAVYDVCGNTLQGISVGWGDEYGYFLIGQELNVSDTSAGEYELKIEADPKNRLVETNDDDNASCVLLYLDAAQLSLNVLNPDSCDASGGPPSGGETITSLDPNTVPKDSITPITITGSGFAPGVTVLFENGSGKAPVVSDVNVVNDGQIDAMVTTRKGGNNSDPIWDLRVGSAVMTDALIVTP